MLRRPIQRRHWIAVFYLLMSLSTFDSYLMHSRVARSLGTFQHSLLPKKHELQYSTGFPWYCQNVSKYSMHRLHFSEKITKCFERSSISVTALNIQRGQWLQISCHLRARQNLHHDHQSHHYRWLMTAATTLAHGKTQGSWSRRWTLKLSGQSSPSSPSPISSPSSLPSDGSHHHGCIHPHRQVFLIRSPSPPSLFSSSSSFVSLPPPSPDQLQLPCGTTDLLFASSQSDSVIKWTNWDWEINEKISSLIIHCIISNLGV